MGVAFESRLPTFVNPQDRVYHSYANHLEQYNLAFQRALSEAIESRYSSSNPRNKEGFGVFTTGSDGRLEKGPQSKVEIVIVGRGDYELDSIVIEEEIQRQLGNVLDPDIEHKNLGTLFISGYSGDLNRTYPTRVLDLKLLYGDPSTREDALSQLVHEISHKDYGKQILEAMTGHRRRARKISESGKNIFRGSEFEHFNLESGVAYYDELDATSPHRISFKPGPMRLVQYGLATEILRNIKNKNFDLDLLNHIPTNTADRLFFFEAEGKTGFTSTEVATLADSYNYFLWLYHLSQENYRTQGKVETRFDKIEVMERMSDIVSLVSSGKLIK